MADLYDDEDDRSQPEGVRILGAETAAEALGRPLPGDTPAQRARPVSFPDDGPTWSADDDVEDDVEADVEPGVEAQVAGEVLAPEVEAIESPDLPHWSEPPTAEMASLGADVVSVGDDDFEAWTTFTAGQPRFRSEGSDWAEADFVEAEVAEAAPAPEIRVTPEPRFDEREVVLEAEVDAPAPARPAPRPPRPHR